jgi:hypothetical protein
MRVDQRRTWTGLAALLVLLPLLAWAFLFLTTPPANSASSTPQAVQEATPMSEAIVDDISISLIAWQQNAEPGQWVATVRVASAAALSVRFIPDLIQLTATSNGATASLAPLAGSSLPCTLHPGDRATLTLLFRLEPGQAAVRLTIGLQEENRSGAHVVFPLGTGAASATGGDGAAGADAQGGDAIGANATATGTPATAATPEGIASPETGSCAH